MKKFLLLILMILVSTQTAWAQRSQEGGDGRPGQEVGNGGWGKVCYFLEHAASPDYTLMSYDLWEGKSLDAQEWVIRDLEKKTLEQYTTYQDILFQVLKDLSKVDSERALLYNKWVYAFQSEAYWKNSPLPKIANDLGVPKNQKAGICDHSEDVLIVRQFSKKENGKKYEVNIKLWKRLDFDSQKEIHKAALVLHEVIYREFLTIGHKDSINVRKFVRYLLSRDFQNLMTKDDTFTQNEVYSEALKEFLTPASTKP